MTPKERIMKRYPASFCRLEEDSYVVYVVAGREGYPVYGSCKAKSAKGAWKEANNRLRMDGRKKRR